MLNLKVYQETQIVEAIRSLPGPHIVTYGY